MGIGNSMAPELTTVAAGTEKFSVVAGDQTMKDRFLMLRDSSFDEKQSRCG
jgi:hypothetical protein